MKNFFKALKITVIPVVLGGLAILSDLVTVFEVNAKDILKENVLYVVLLITFTFILVYIVVLIQENISLKKEINTKTTDSLKEDISQLEKKCEQLKNENKNLVISNKSLSQEIDEFHDNNKLYDELNKSNNINSVQEIISLIQDLERDFRDIVKYNKIKVKHKTAYESYKRTYNNEFTKIEVFYHRYLEKFDYNIKYSPKEIFEESSINCLCDKILGPRVEHELNDHDFKALQKFTVIKRQSLEKYLAYIQSH